MPCDTMRLPEQTMTQRMEEVRTAAQKIDAMLASRKIGVKVGPQGAVAFTGLSDADRRRMTDACIYRRIMQSGSAASKMAIARAEQMAGVRINKSTVAAGVHSHDGGASWHPKG
jgi:sugar (pentulose or hexulose) kinase